MLKKVKFTFESILTYCNANACESNSNHAQKHTKKANEIDLLLFFTLRSILR